MVTQGATARGPLAGTRVLDLVDGAGGYGPKLLAGLGADVIRVEPPGGSAHRRRAPLLHAADAGAANPSLYFLHYNAGKRGITLDPARPPDRERLARLLDHVDVVMDNGELRRWGFDLDALAAKRPPLVVVSVTPFGLDGPRAGWAGGDLVCQAMSGMIHSFGYRGDRPARFGPEQASEMSGLAAAYGALVALFGARRSGEGERVDVAMERVGALVTFQMSNASLFHQFGFKRPRAVRGDGLPSGLFRARDGYIAIGAWRDADETIALLASLGCEGELPAMRRELSHEAFLADPRANATFTAFAAAYTRAELADLVQSHGMLGLPVHDARDLVQDPFLQRRGLFVEVDPRSSFDGLRMSGEAAGAVGERAALLDVGAPIRFGRTPYVPGRRAPRLGEHNVEVFAELDTDAPRPPEPAPAAAHPGPVEGRAEAPNPAQSVEGPLAGVRVLDLSWIIAGPLAARLLADFGADVIKVESRHRMDVGRANRIPLFGVLPGDANSNPDTGGYFQDANAGKRSCTIDLGCDQGRALLLRLAAACDVVICNLAGDQLERWGIGYERLRALNPRVIVVNMPSMESEGPRRAWRGFGDMFVGVAGLKSVSGHPTDPPLPWGHQYADFSSNPFHAAIAVMAALAERERSGEGQFIEISQYESTVAIMGPSILEYGARGEPPRPRGNADVEGAPHDFYRCAAQSPDAGTPFDDAWCAIAVFDDAQWRALVDATGVASLAPAEYATAAGRRAHASEIGAALEAWTSTRDKHAVAETLQAAGVPAGPYQAIDDMVLRDPVLAEHFVAVDHPSGRTFLVHGAPAQTRRRPPVVTRAPLIGEHTFEVLSDVLGLSADEIAEYAAVGALE
jgi:crotonobetainyl-CoA:carnitine CoA-transferase CaiB-like acyl-CoA transferase